MTHLTKPLCLLAVGLGCLTSLAREYEGSRENSILLNGQWEFVFGDGSEHAETAAGQRRIDWQEVTLPGPFMKWNQEVANRTKFVWARRSFTVTRAQAESLAVLRWNRIGSGAAAFINGQKVGENEPTGPFQVIVPKDVLRSGKNQIVLKIRGAAGVRRSQSGNALIPAGFGVGMPEVTDDVWIDFADGAYMKWLLSLPDLGGSRVKIRHDPRFSRVFPYEDIEPPLLEGIDPQWLIRWNGFPGTVAFGALEGPAMAGAEKILWAREPKTTVMAAVPAASGGGRIVFSQLDLQGRVDRSKPNYDPVAERVLLNLLGPERLSDGGAHR